MLDTISIPVAFLAGISTFFASCLAPLTPTYIAYLSGITAEQLGKSATPRPRRWQMAKHAFFFVLGFIVVFVLMGIGATQVGRFLAMYRNTFQQVGGIFLMLVGLFLMGWVKPEWIMSEKKIHLNSTMKLGVWHSILVGVTFGFAWTPCIGPVLSVILLAASLEESRMMGALLLLWFALGLGLPFLLLGFFFEYFAPIVRKYGKYGNLVQKFTGVFIFLSGFLLLLGKLRAISFTFSM